MDALAFLEKHGIPLATRVAELAGSNYAYFSQIAYGHRRPSVELADRLVAASEQVIDDPAYRLDVLSLLRSESAPVSTGSSAGASS